MFRFRWRRIALACCCLVGLRVAAAAAEIVVLDDGRFLKAAHYAVDGDRVRLELAIGGTMDLPLLRVDRIVEDEVAAVADDPLEGPSIDLGFSDQPVPADTPFGDSIVEIARRRNVNPALVAAIVRAESAFDPMAVSKKGARGLMQLMPATARRFGTLPDDLFDAEINVETGVAYLGDLISRYASDLALVLAAYNAGERAVEEYRGVPPYRETREYIRRIYSLLGVAPVADETPGK
jgi:Transglycosylase SLT domain